MKKEKFYGGSSILSLTSRKKLPRTTRAIVVKTGATHGVKLPSVASLWSRGVPLWYLINDDSVDLEVYDYDDVLLKVVPPNDVAIIGFSGVQYDIMIRDKYQSAYFPFTATPLSVTITENQENFNLRDYVLANTDYDGITPLLLSVTIASGVTIGGTDPLTPAFDTDNWSSGTTIHLYNNGEILGAGGGISSHTYAGGGEGGRGGDALKLQNSLVLYNVNGRIASGGGQGAQWYQNYVAGSPTTIIQTANSVGGGQGYIGGAGKPSPAGPTQTPAVAGSPSAPGVYLDDSYDTAYQDQLFNTKHRGWDYFGNGGWWGCSGEEFGFYEAELINNYGTSADKNLDGTQQSFFSGGPGRSILNAEYLVVDSIGKITGPSADFVNNEYVYYLSEPYAMQIPLGKTLKKIGWDGVTAPTVSVYVHPQTVVGHWQHYIPRNKEDWPAQSHPFTVDGFDRLQPNTILIESDWPVATSISIENHGKIYGGGGLGRFMWRHNFQGSVYDNQRIIAGPNGGNALGIYYSTTIDNQGTIAGGGGGTGVKQVKVSTTENFWGYTINKYSSGGGVNEIIIPGQGGGGAGFAYGPYAPGHAIQDTTTEGKDSPNASAAGNLTTGGRGGIGIYYKNTIVQAYRKHFPYGDVGRIYETSQVWNGVILDYQEIVIPLDLDAEFRSTAHTAWNTDWNTAPYFPIPDTWFNEVPTQATGGSVGQAGADAGTPMSDWSSTTPEIWSEELGGPNLSAGQPGYYSYGNSYVTWLNIGTLNGLVGG